MHNLDAHQSIDIYLFNRFVIKIIFLWYISKSERFMKIHIINNI
jgi:hypothetical protein